MKVVVIGSAKVPFVYSYVKFFNSLGHEVLFLNSSKEMMVRNVNYINLYEHEHEHEYVNHNKLQIHFLVKKWVKILLTKLKLDRSNFFIKFFESKEALSFISEKYETRLLELLKEDSIDLVFSLWGTTLRKEINTLSSIKEKNNFKFKMIHSVNTYPVRLNLSKNDFIKKIPSCDRDFFNNFDGVIVPTSRMKSLFSKNFGYVGDVLVSPDFLHKDFFDMDACLKQPIKKSLIFLGNVNFLERTIDNVSSKINDILNSGIEVWVQAPCDIKHNNLKTFKSFSLDDIATGKLSSFISQFSGAIVFYNDLNNLRSSISYPTRFALSTLSNKPIFVESGVFDGLEEDLSEINSPVVFYRNIDQLKYHILNDKNSISHDDNYFINFEAHLSNFDLFIKKVCK